MMFASPLRFRLKLRLQFNNMERVSRLESDFTVREHLFNGLEGMNSSSCLGETRALVPLEGQHLRHHLEVKAEPSLDTTGTNALILASQSLEQRNKFLYFINYPVSGIWLA